MSWFVWLAYLPALEAFKLWQQAGSRHACSLHSDPDTPWSAVKAACQVVMVHMPMLPHSYKVCMLTMFSMSCCSVHPDSADNVFCLMSLQAHSWCPGFARFLSDLVSTAKSLRCVYTTRPAYRSLATACRLPDRAPRQCQTPCPPSPRRKTWRICMFHQVGQNTPPPPPPPPPNSSHCSVAVSACRTV